MALVRCSCIVELHASADGRGAVAVDVKVPAPECGYVVHRLGAELWSEIGTESGTWPDVPRG